MKDVSAFRVGSFTALLVLVCLAASHWLYLVLVVPALPGLIEVPLVWWFGLAAPVALAVFMGGWKARSVGATLGAAGASLLVILSYNAIGAALNLRGFLKADPADSFWSVGTLLWAVLVLGLSWGGHMARTQFGSVENAS